MKVIYREGKKEDSLRVAELDNIASDGAIEFLFHDLIPNMTPVQIELTKSKARNEGYHSLCLLVFKDNTNAQNVYKKNGFEVIDWIELPSHKLMPHEGGCVLMKAII